MKFEDTLSYLNSFQNFEKVHFTSNRAWNLDGMKLLLKRARHPQRSYERVLIAGTKGKGSTGFFLESMLEASGVHTGFYSSPHLIDPRERIRIGGHMISREAWVRGMREVVKAAPRGSAFTYFEIMTLLAAVCFRQAGVRLGIFEVGMGGRLDATNALDHGLSILTPIHLDHEAVLGNTIAKIAAEKAAIIRKRSDVVTGTQVPEAMTVIRGTVKAQKAVLQQASAYKGEVGLAGMFQKANAGTAFKAASLLARKMKFRLADSFRFGGWPGRMEFLEKGLLIDAAHNPVSIEALADSLKEMGIKDPVLVFGTSRDKNSGEMLSILSRVAERIVVTPFQGSRSQRLDILMKQASEHFKIVVPASGPREAVALARKLAAKSKIVVTGSFYVIGEVKKGFHA